MSLASLLLRTGVIQFLVQACGFVGGILIVRTLPVSEYAVYTLLYAALGTMTALADAGVASSVMAQLGRTPREPARIGAIVATGLAYRRRFSSVVALLALPVIAVLLVRQQVGAAAIVLALGTLLLAYLPTASAAVLEVPLKMQPDVMPLQRLQLQSNLLRLALLALMLPLLPLALPAMLASALVQLWTNLRLRNRLRSQIDMTVGSDPAAGRDIARMAGRTLPGAVYYCVAGHLNVWILAALGTHAAVAQVGALGRLAMVFNVVNAVIAMLALPRFAALPNDRDALTRFVLRIGLAFGGLVFAATFLAWLFPQQILWILGGQYRMLSNEVLLTALAGSLACMATAFNSLNSVRAYLPPAWLHPVVGVSHTAVLMALIDIRSVSGLLLMQAILSGFSVFYSMLIFLFYSRAAHERAAYQAT